MAKPHFGWVILSLWMISTAYTAEQEVLYPFQTDSNFINISDWPGLQVDLKYSTTDNFLGEDIYGAFDQAFLHRLAAQKLELAIKYLQKECPKCQFVIYDALRPRSIQWKLWNHVVPLKKTLYVANPKKGSVHNYGFAIDLSIVDSTGRALDMGTPYDSFKPLAQPRYQEAFLKKGLLTQTQVNHRLMLKKIMVQAGFYPIFSEWWHFNAFPGKYVRRTYPIQE